MERWEIAETTWLLRSGFMDVRRDRCHARDGRRSRDYFGLDLKDFCEVVAVTPARELLLAREYKHGARRIMTTLPAGFIEPGESPEEAARRELLEETGYSAPAFQLLGSFQLVPDLKPPAATWFSLWMRRPRRLHTPTRTRRSRSTWFPSVASSSPAGCRARAISTTPAPSSR